MSKIDDMRIRLGVEAKMSRRKQLSTLLGSRQTGYPNRKAQTEWPGCKSRGNVYDKRRHKEIGRRREEGEENHSNPNAQVTDECM